MNGETRIEIGDETAPIRDVVGRGPPPAMLQTVVEDNGQLLWESPTQGPPIDLAAFPPGLRLALSVRVKAFMEDPQGELVVQAMGPELSSWADRILAQSGFSWAEMDRLQIGLYAGEGDVYAPLFQVVLNAPIAPDQLATRWNGEWLNHEPDHPESATKSRTCRAGEQDYLVWQDLQDDKVQSFMFGPSTLVAAARDGGPQRPLAGVWRQLADVSDSNRHLTVIFIASALFNEAGQNLMSGPWHNLNRRLRTAFGDTVRGGLMSLHFDQGNYVELIVNHQPDHTGAEVAKLLISELRAARDEAIEAIADAPAHPYWNRVRMRFGNMLTDAVRQTRAGVERGHVVMNAWLPPAGIQNLLAANRIA
ncbi:MAG TPA: hypothetical protein PKD54_16500 [Pirellulaceae bacterium]|nr:hypothetical protein [Pirellulaceae bacterium]